MCEQFEIREPVAVFSFGLNQRWTFNTTPAFGFSLCLSSAEVLAERAWECKLTTAQ